AAVALYAADLLVQSARVFEDQSATEHVAMAGEIFGDRVHHDVSPKPERELKQRRGPGVVTSQESVGFLGNLRDGANIGDMQQRVGGCFNPDEFGGGGYRALYRCQVLHVDQRVLEPPVGQQAFEQDGGAVKDIVAGNDVVAGRKRVQQCERSGVAGGESQCGNAFFERCQGFFQRRTVGIVSARVEKAAGQAAVIGLLKRGGEVDGGSNVAGAAFRMASGMDGAGFDFHRKIRIYQTLPQICADKRRWEVWPRMNAKEHEYVTE